ncbi:PAS domain-containing protein [Glaciecola sp. MH2013]|uniref:CheR family methyltransferase n=1 Tax=Glaciecola sp. MH2013 TaxID=2785524 RepID=UPI00189C9345|nr:CheR family methyltransferase [Glaciecola sp. MH2013]MBF7073354.1 PAS domain-containing protein [Glaciecola sp. MH2013]
MSSGSKDDQDKMDTPSHYIGIGTSAGGLEALQIVLQNLPVDTGACFVIVQHLSPNFKSMMLELLSKHTSMHIENVTDGVKTKANTIYLLPPKKSMIVAKGELQLTEKIADSGLNLPIDIFFRSLAEDQQHLAIGVILSGTGSDGSRGIKALKEVGALVVAQEPESAKFDGMPNSAINTGIVDLILRPEDIGEKLAQYINHPLVNGQTESVQKDIVSSKEVMNEIFNLLKIKSDIDFSKYKVGTIARRIERRMTIKQIASLRDYLTLLFKDIYEVQALSKELLIGVTRFFRDDKAFENIRNIAIPNIVKHSQQNSLIRIWVAACSSGEEAYSIAIMVEEELRKQALIREVKVFATDVNPAAINEASAGVYTAEIENDVAPYILKTYFSDAVGGGYQVNQSIRNKVVFATHNVITDPPFSNIDLVTCRNVLIYFQNEAQKRVLSSLYFALKARGYLFLGSSENLGELDSHFKVVEERSKIYQKVDDVKLPIVTSSKINKTVSKVNTNIPTITDLMKSYRGGSHSDNGLNFINEALITQFVCPCIILNDELQAIHVYGDLGNYTRRLPPGRISTAITDLVNDDICIALSSALQRARHKNEEVYYSDIVTNSREGEITFNLRVKYIKEHDLASAPGFFWLIFEQVSFAPVSSVQAERFDVNQLANQRIEDLELELKFNKEHLQVTIEELETTNEELQSANEELMSANEELQSTNEELQSVNEELHTVNSEFQEKILQISQANGDLDEVLLLSNIGIIFLDENLNVRRYTDAVKTYINLQENDVNRPIHHISNNIQYNDLLSDVSVVARSGKMLERELTLDNKQVLRITVNSYNYSDISMTKGVAITFTDISQVRYMEMGMVVAYKQLRSSVNNALEMLDTGPFKKQVNILILDDSASYLELLEHQISKVTGYACTVFKSTSIDEAFEHIHNQSIDVCISDYFLEGETALDFIDKLADKNIDIPVIVITGDATDELTPLLFSHGALDLIEKDDLSPALLTRSVRFAVRRHQIDQHINNLIIDKVSQKEAL